MIWFLATSNCTIEKAGIDFEITNEKIRLFLKVLLLTGYHKLPDHKVYWEATPDTFSRSSFQWLISQLEDFQSSLSTGTTNPS